MGDWSREEGRSSDSGAASFLSGPTVVQQVNQDLSFCQVTLVPGLTMPPATSACRARDAS